MKPELPAPLTPSDCDLRDFPDMFISIQRLRNSKAWALAKRRPEVGFFMFNLWCGAWHQVPAGSIPDDDIELADIAMASNDDQWKSVRDAALRGWIKCSDGRLYHPVVAEYVLDAWGRKGKFRDRMAAAREAKARKKSASITDSITEPVSDQSKANGRHNGTPAVDQPIGQTGTGTGTISKNIPTAACDSDPRPVAPALAIIRKFIEAKRQRWPNDPHPPPANASQHAIAETWLQAAAGRLDLALAAVAAAVERYRGDQGPRSLTGIELSVKAEIAKQLQPQPAPPEPAERPGRHEQLSDWTGYLTPRDQSVARTYALADLELKVFEMAGMDRLNALKARGQLNLAERTMRGAYQAGERDAKALVEAGRKAIETATQGTSHARSERADAGSPAHA